MHLKRDDVVCFGKETYVHTNAARRLCFFHVLSVKESCVSEKRPMHLKRDLCFGKETYVHTNAARRLFFL